MKKIDFTKVVTFHEDGVLKRLTATISLDDDCKNGCCDFHITGKVDYKARNGRWVFESCGCIHDEVSKHIKSFAPFTKLHLCNYMGQPMYPIENGMYIMREDFKRGMDFLRISKEECNKLAPAAVLSDKLYFKYMLFHLGIVDRWQKEANELISFIQENCGQKWENPYPAEEERFVLRLTQEEIDEVESKNQEWVLPSKASRESREKEVRRPQQETSAYYRRVRQVYGESSQRERCYALHS